MNIKRLFAVLAASLSLYPACAPRRAPGDSALRSTPDANLTIDDKLDAQIKRNELLRARGLQVVAGQKQLLDRATWDQAVNASDQTAFTPEDLAALKTRQDALVAKNRAAARASSTLDLDAVRTQHKVAEFCSDLPKGGLLHVHPWGTLDRPTVREIMAKVNPTIDFAKLRASLNDPGGSGALYPEELKTFDAIAARAAKPTVKLMDLPDADKSFFEGLYFLPPGNHPFDRFTATFTAISALTFGSPYDAEPLMFDRFLERAKAHHVDYVEISRYIVPKPQWFQSLGDWATKMEGAHGVTVRLLASFARNKDADFTRTKTEQLLKFPESPILLGVNLLNDESLHPALEKGQTLYFPILQAVNAGQSHLRRTMHAGELGDPHNVRDAIIMGAERIGHGVDFADDVVTLEWARRIQLPIEINLYSNIRLKVASDVKTHPFLRYLRLGLPVSLSTDDEGIFESTIDTECELAVGDTDITYAEMRAMSENSIKTSFADQATKTRLLADLANEFTQLEAKWSPTIHASTP